MTSFTFQVKKNTMLRMGPTNTICQKWATKTHQMIIVLIKILSLNLKETRFRVRSLSRQGLSERGGEKQFPNSTWNPETQNWLSKSKSPKFYWINNKNTNGTRGTKTAKPTSHPNWLKKRIPSKMVMNLIKVNPRKTLRKSTENPRKRTLKVQKEQTGTTLKSQEEPE